jgi:hypothetical protein
LNHFKLNQEHLEQLLTSEANQDYLDFVQGCHAQMVDLIDSLNEGAHSSGQPGTPYPGGECSYDFEDNFTDLLRSSRCPYCPTSIFSGRDGNG